VWELTARYNSRAFWNQRFKKHGHTGEVDRLLYAYDQPQRLRAINEVLHRTRIPLDRGTKILDIGCGTGDLIESLLNRAAPEIVGIDVSDETIVYAQRRFSGRSGVKLLVMRLEDLNFLPASFNLIFGINVLQHITDAREFSTAIGKMVRILRNGGYIFVMDFSPLKVKDRTPAPYVIIRPRDEYVKAFEDKGCKLVCEFGLPRIGVRLYRLTFRIIVKTYRAVAHRFNQRPYAKTSSSTEVRETKETKNAIALRVLHIIGVVVLALAKPFDYTLIPFPGRLTDMRILVFKKAS